MLLTEHGRAKVADVGLARMVPNTQSYLTGGNGACGGSRAGGARFWARPLRALHACCAQRHGAAPAPLASSGRGYLALGCARAAVWQALHHQGRHIRVCELGNAGASRLVVALLRTLGPSLDGLGQPSMAPPLMTPPLPLLQGVVLWEICTGMTPVRGHMRDVK